MTEDEQRLLDLYSFIKAALECCQIEVIKARDLHGDEILTITTPMVEEFGAFWSAFRAKWNIPAHPFEAEILEIYGGESYGSVAAE
jgi:hypothetical protein